MIEWHATGWRGRTVLQYTAYLGGGMFGNIWRRGQNAPWSYRTSGDYQVKHGLYKRRNKAIEACEEHMRKVCRHNLRQLRR